MMYTLMRNVEKEGNWLIQMSFRRSRYFLGEAFRGLIRNRLMSIASILTVASCLLVVSVFYVLFSNINLFLHGVEGTLGIVVFVYNEVEAADLHELHQGILAIEHVAGADFVNHEAAFEVVLGWYDDPGIFAGIPPDTFPRHFNVDIRDLRYHDIVLAHLEGLVPLGIEHIGQRQGIVHMIIAVSNMVQWVSSILILILATISIIIITNTIRITVNARQVEINIMKFVGATDWFIRWPFLMEGILIGIIGSLVPVAMVWAGYDQVIRMLEGSMPVIEFVEFMAGSEIFVLLFPFVICLGGIIGAVGSVISIRRHLHV